MPLAPANQSQLIRSSQKDEYYQVFLRNKASASFQTLAGSKLWLDWRKELELLADLAYHGLTTFSGYQTLGEEYVNVIQVDPSKHKIPSWARRGVFVLCYVFCPYLLDKVLVCLENELNGGQESCNGVRWQHAVSGLWSLELLLKRWMQRALRLLSVSQRKACLPVVPILQHGVTLLHRLHVAFFYINGSIYHLSKRAAGISYVSVTGLSGSDRTIRNSYKLLGTVSVLQLLITICLHFNTWRQRYRARQELKRCRNPSSQRTQCSGSRVTRCILCLEERRHSTSTPCGHLFCWECITEWCNMKC
ncbi:peroxisome biogenesis factor 10 isoform X2 [Antennarius striatus]|uniref:peroxisome biogenesis factor 10 isoform X2 n=1 Tax=Antennarius striatus TaxID=241820 RepID=UPI0035B203A0